jgi:hypothetical protein
MRRSTVLSLSPHLKFLPLHFTYVPTPVSNQYSNQGKLTEGEGSVRFTSSIR